MEEQLIQLINELTPNQLERFEALINENKDEYIKRLTFNIGIRDKKDNAAGDSNLDYSITTTNKIQRCPRSLKRRRLPTICHKSNSECHYCGLKRFKSLVIIGTEQYCFTCTESLVDGIPNDYVQRLPPPGEGRRAGLEATHNSGPA